jgi:hypothetical protein
MIYECVLRQSNLGSRSVWKKFIFVSIFVPNKNLWLECGSGLALRTQLAGLIGIGTTFGSEEDESPPLAANAEEFGTRALEWVWSEEYFNLDFLDRLKTPRRRRGRSGREMDAYSLLK